MKKVTILLSTVAAIALSFTSCGSSGSTADTPFTGYFIDSPVENLTYTCGNLIGTTDKDGKFECPDLPVTFEAGGIILGSMNKVTADKEVHPQDLVGVDRNITDNTDVLEIASLLLSLDDDGYVSDGIKIADGIKLADGIKFSDITPAELNVMLNNAGKEQVTSDLAKMHLNDEEILEDAKKTAQDILDAEEKAKADKEKADAQAIIDQKNKDAQAQSVIDKEKTDAEVQKAQEEADAKAKAEQDKLNAEAAAAQAEQRAKDAKISQGFIDEAKELVTFESIKGDNQSESNITTNLVFPTTFENNVKVTFSSSNSSVLSDIGVVIRPFFTDDGIVTRPNASTGPSFLSGVSTVPVTLTVTLSHGIVSERIKYDLFIIPTEMTDADSIEYSIMSLSSLIWENTDNGIVTSANKLNLPTQGSYGTTISSYTFSPEGYINADGTIIQPTAEIGDIDMRLEATIIKGEEERGMILGLTVKALEAVVEEPIIEEPTTECSDDPLEQLLGGKPACPKDEDTRPAEDTTEDNVNKK